jgi:hypothetical protein
MCRSFEPELGHLRRPRPPRVRGEFSWRMESARQTLKTTPTPASKGLLLVSRRRRGYCSVDSHSAETLRSPCDPSRRLWPKLFVSPPHEDTLPIVGSDDDAVDM